ncbi:hypothetical protein G6F46_005896 [Rhizopus delemar]|uniref:Uncharacterized protein n=3 Tax=Rhizopus TaxID=4842 RepID=I1BIT7_RHIO9|nr:hypothetical protein RO3G_00821 [Rhizopus delemar RA 99-880]KAG1448572.1 hypothetical protein G6F55_010584 [Rhizopus delemar]KAG1544636.1 hypothetical protein G6F51_005944 [Rhizopus arrhizus]KAG1490298.1 hypothetical protein G6F54_010824 [Rhizopus delemar]KAG1511546.1 hypothetical protein G6F52_010621 [Rhizopus delemar]|eukprot:EIE76117.1 hypothetical protein RO3G_00821 [Rhizopus delemar RA 99-880]
MGSQTSKVARRLPTKARPETLQNAPTESPTTLKAQIQAASELKTEFIEEDGRDPHLHEHLRSIGEVAIPPTITKMRTSDAMLGIVNERKKADSKELTEGIISIDAVYSLLEERKRLNPGEVDLVSTRQRWIEKYKVNQDTLSALLKYYGTMAVMPVAADDKEDRRMGVWVSDKADWERKVREVEERNEKIEKAKKDALKDNNREKDGKENMSQEEKKLKDLFEDDL